MIVKVLLSLFKKAFCPQLCALRLGGRKAAVNYKTSRSDPAPLGPHFRSHISLPLFASLKFEAYLWSGLYLKLLSKSILIYFIRDPLNIMVESGE